MNDLKFMLGVYKKSTAAELVEEFMVVDHCYHMFLSGGQSLVNSPVLEYLSETRDIMLNVIADNYIKMYAC